MSRLRRLIENFLNAYTYFKGLPRMWQSSLVWNKNEDNYWHNAAFTLT